MSFSLNFSILSIILFSLAIVCIAYILAVYNRRLRMLVSHCDKCENESMPSDSSYPDVSVIVFAKSEPEATERFIQSLTQQEYPSDFEIIVVNEGPCKDTRHTIDRLKETYPRLYLTYTPDGARNLSRKKLGLTLGIKASKGDVIVVTDVYTKIASKQWLKTLTRSFAQKSTDIVLGYGQFSAPTAKMPGRATRLFDLAADTSTWMTSAIAGKPYRGCGYNLAYKRELFFDNKGFSRSLNIREGDDDIFVSEIAAGKKTVVELNKNAFVEREAQPFMIETSGDRTSHYFTGEKLTKRARRIMAAGEWCLWIILLCGLLGAIASGIANLAGWLVALILFALGLLSMILSWRKPLSRFGVEVKTVYVPLMALTRPIRNIGVAMKSKFAKTGQYTWQ